MESDHISESEDDGDFDALAGNTDVEGNAGAEPQDFAQDGLLAAAHSRPKRAKRPNRLYAGGEFDTTID